MRTNPLLLFLLSLVLVRVAGTFTEKGGWHLWAKVPATWVAVVLFSITSVGYVLVPAYFDHVEPTVASVSWAVIQGQEPHPSPDAGGMYGFAYGPMLYLMNGFALVALGPGILTSKVVGVVAALGSLALLAVALRRAGRPGWSAAIGWTALLLLTFGAPAFWVRAEPLLLMCSSLSLVGLMLPAPGSALVVGLALGVGVNLKVTAMLYLLPALTYVWRRHGVSTLLGTFVVAAFVAALPYLASDTISAASYAYWIQQATTHGIRLSAVPTVLQWAVFILLPFGATSLLYWRMRNTRDDSDVLFRAVLIGAVLASVPLAAKHGTGPYHFVPFIPMIGFGASLGGDGAGDAPRRGLVAALFLTCVLLAAIQLQHWLTLTTSLPSGEIISELRRVEARYDGTMAIGYGSSQNYRVSFYRPVLVFDGHPLVLDAAGMMDRHWTRGPFPPAALDTVMTCRINTWLIPRGGAPFQLSNAYPIDGPVVPEEIRDAFEARYHVVERGRWFDVWRCR